MSYDNKVQVIAAGGIPIGIPSSGTVGVNGALTLTTALGTNFYRNIWLYFPAGAVFSGSPAGIYFCQMTSATLGTIYNNRYVNGVPNVPPVLNPVVDPGPGAYTQSTSEQVILSIIVRGNTLQPNSAMRIQMTCSTPNNANTKTARMPWGASNFLSISLTNAASQTIFRVLHVRGDANQQVMAGNNQLIGGSSTSAQVQHALDLTADQTTGMAFTLSVATDYMIVEGFTIEALLGP